MADNEKKPTRAQLLALEHKGADLLISAGAGSGKTYTLTKKIVADIEAGADITKMLVVTFTKEASSKLKLDITSALAKAFEKNPTSRWLASQIVKASTAEISTIDSYCYKLVKENFEKITLDSGVQLDSKFRIGSDGELKVLQYDALDEVLDELYEATPPDKDFLVVADCYSSIANENVLKDNLLGLYENLSNTKDFLETINKSIDYNGDFMDTPFARPLLDSISEALAHFRKMNEDAQRIISLDEVASEKYISSVSSDKAFLDRLEEALKEPKYSTLCSVFSSYSFVELANKKRDTIDLSVPKACRDEIRAFVGDAKKGTGYLGKYFSSTNTDAMLAIEQNAKMCKAIYKILKLFDERYEKKKAQYSVFSFSDVSRYALKLLYKKDGTISELAEEIAKKYSVIYIDEYQDTNSVQDKIFSAISSNNRFMVGDIKQSIYSFRYAEPEIFSGYRSNFVDKELPCDDERAGRSLFMSENFRCNEEVIDFANLVSQYLFKKSKEISYVDKDDLKFHKVDGLSPVSEPATIRFFEKITAPRKNDPDYDSKLALAEASDISQEEWVAKEINRLIKKGKLENGKELKKSDIAIILRSTKDGKAQKYIDALKKYGIGSEYQSYNNFFDKPHILLALCLLNTIDNPYKDVYLAGAMRSQIFNFSLDELVKIRSISYDRARSLYSVVKEYSEDEEIVKKINSMISVLDELRKSVRKQSAHQVISCVLNDLGLLALCNKDERQDLLKLYNMAREYEGNSFKGLYKFLRYVDDNMSSKVKESLTNGDEDNVQIMTIHGSKGLEYEYCFFADLEAKIDPPAYKIPPILFNRELGLTGYVGRDNALVKFNSLARKCVLLASQRSSREDEMRMMYVALTRARTRIYITATINSPDEKVQHYRDFKDYLSAYEVFSANSRVEYILGAMATMHSCYDYESISPTVTAKAEASSKKEPEHQVDMELVKKYRKKLKRRFKAKYKFSYLSEIPSKLSVSRLSPRVLDGNENDTLEIDKALDDMPKFLMNNEKQATGADKGTATHVFMQFCDFERLKQKGYDAELRELENGFFIDKNASHLINKKHIELFATRSIFDEMLDAQKSKRLLEREFRFNVMLSAREFSSNPLIQKEKILVQGIIDCIFEDKNGNLVLVDYKTDKVTRQNYIDVLTERYTDQLSYYRDAVDLLFGKKVSRTLIYSVPIGEVIEIKRPTVPLSPKG